MKHLLCAGVPRRLRVGLPVLFFLVLQLSYRALTLPASLALPVWFPCLARPFPEHQPSKSYPSPPAVVPPGLCPESTLRQHLGVKSKDSQSALPPLDPGPVMKPIITPLQTQRVGRAGGCWRRTLR